MNPVECLFGAVNRPDFRCLALLVFRTADYQFLARIDKIAGEIIEPF